MLVRELKEELERRAIRSITSAQGNNSRRGGAGGCTVHAAIHAMGHGAVLRAHIWGRSGASLTFMVVLFLVCTPYAFYTLALHMLFGFLRTTYMNTLACSCRRTIEKFAVKVRPQQTLLPFYPDIPPCEVAPVVGFTPGNPLSVSSSATGASSLPSKQQRTSVKTCPSTGLV